MTIVSEQWIQNRPRNTWTAFVWGLLTGIFGLFAISCLVAAVNQPGLLLFAVAFAPFAYGCFRYARGAYRAGLFIGVDEVVVRNPLKTFRLRRRDVERFVAGGQDYGVANPVPGVLVVGRDGAKTRVWTLAREGLVWQESKNIRRWEQTADELSALLAVRDAPEAKKALAHDARLPTGLTGGGAAADNHPPSGSADASVSGLRETEKALRAVRLLTTGSYLILLAIFFNAQRTTGTDIVIGLSVILAIGGYAFIEKVRRDTLRKGADPITGHTPGQPLPLDTTTRIAFAAQLLIAAGLFVVFS